MLITWPRETDQSVGELIDLWRLSRSTSLVCAEGPIASCELCEHPEIRYQFKITNRHNGNELLVGSECINKFGIAATDDLGRVLSADASRRKVNRDRRFLITEARSRRQIATLIALAREEVEFQIDSSISYVQDRGAFTPNQLAFLFWRLHERGVVFKLRDFKVIMRRDREKAQLHQMPHFKLKHLWPALSSSQRAWVASHTNFRP